MPPFIRAVRLWKGVGGKQWNDVIPGRGLKWIETCGVGEWCCVWASLLEKTEHVCVRLDMNDEADCVPFGVSVCDLDVFVSLVCKRIRETVPACVGVLDVVRKV